MLNCINQYECITESADERGIERDRALLYGLLRPMTSVSNGESVGASSDVEKLRALLANLAFQLRVLRRRAVWPLVLTVVWYIFSIGASFTYFGDRSYAHSLAFALLISWLPVLVSMALVDRNPIGALRCRVLIERWLQEVHNVLQEHDKRQVLSDSQGRLVFGGPGYDIRRETSEGAVSIKGLHHSDKRPTETQKSKKGNISTSRDGSIKCRYFEELASVRENALPTFKGNFIRQGRSLHYCGITQAVFAICQYPGREFEQAAHARSTQSAAKLDQRPLDW